jgi:hypothetical protein
MASFEKKEGDEKPLTTTEAFEAVAKGSISPEDAADKLLEQDKKQGFLIPRTAKFRNSIRSLFGLHKLVTDKNEALYMVGEDGEKLKYVFIKIRDKEVCLEAIKNNWKAIKYIPKELWGDKEVALGIVSLWGELLEHVSERLRADEDVVRAAVTQNGRAMRFAAENLWGDKELVEIGNKTYRHRKKERG